MRRHLVLTAVLLLCVVAFAVAAKDSGPLIEVSEWSGEGRGDMLADLAKAIEELKGDDSRYLARAGHLLLRAGRVEEASDRFRRSLASDPKDDEAWVIIALAYSEAEMWNQADEWFRRAVDKDPKDSDHRAEWGASLLNRGERDRAIEMLAQALNGSPKSARLYYKIGRSLE